MLIDTTTRRAAFFGVFAALLAASVVSSRASAAVIGYWRFEDGGFLADSSGNDFTLSAHAPSGGSAPVQYALPSSGPGSAFFDPIPGTGAANAHAAYTGDATGGWFIHSPENTMNPNAFTIEALVHLTTANTGSLNSTMIASRWHGTNNQRAWGLGVATTDAGGFTGSNPQTEQGLFLALSSGGTGVNSTLDPGIRIETGRDYYVAAAYAPPAGGNDGSVTFYVKDLTNSGPIQTATLPTAVSVFQPTTGRFEIGSLNVNNVYRWKGYIDEARFSDTPLKAGQLMMIFPPPSNPVFSWLLDGNATAYLGGMDGTAHGTPALTYPSTSPVPSLAYDGNRYASFTANQWIDFGNEPELQITDAITVSFWFNTEDARTTATRYFLNNWNANASERSWAVGVGSNRTGGAGELRLLLSGNGSALSHDYRSTFNVNDGEWHHVAFTFDAQATEDQARLFLDGVELTVGAGLVKTSENIIGALNMSGDKLIAGRRGDASPSSSTYYSGLLDEVAIWNSVLTPDEIAWLASNSIRAIPEPGTLTLLVLGLLGFIAPRRRHRA